MKSWLRHYFTPHFHNNFRAKLLHDSSLFLITLAFIFAGLSSVVIHRANPEVLGISYSISSDELLAVTNRYRTEQGLTPLTMNSQLAQAAQAKATDMYQKNYWAHFAPDGSTSPWGFIRGSGYSYLYAGENLAKGYTNSEDVVKAWMNSQSHRENMLSKNYKDIGFAIVPGMLEGEDTVLVVEMFGSVDSPLVPEGNGNTAAIQEEPATVPVPTTTKVTEMVPSRTGAVNAALPSVSYETKPLIDIRKLSQNTVFIVLVSIFLALLLDVIIIERKKIPRFVGHNIDHIMLIGIFIILVVIQSVGKIL